ncbi:MAG: hypothetical protein KAI74_01205 [Kiritimatiellae bacterium]|nr:hypothetical protein [Kiritimatiellia bacterium]
MKRTKEQLEIALDDFNLEVRKSALSELTKMEVSISPKKVVGVNLHAHTFFSYNAYGYSPLHFAWLAKARGLAVAGIVDFDVLDGLDEFVAAGRVLGLKTCTGIESRVFVPEFADRVINSPGEPGVSYHLGIGFTDSVPTGWACEFLAKMRSMAAARNGELVRRVNVVLDSVQIDMEQDVMPLTPSGNATERHICLAYARKAAEKFSDDKGAAYWASKLDSNAGEVDVPDGPMLLDLIRAKLMKRGGAGYVQPGKDTFPELAEMNRFILEAGAIPVITWLDGTTEGEQEIDELLSVEMASGGAAINIIPDRNFTAGVEDVKLSNLKDIIVRARKLGLPILVGTEMNKDGNLFVDDFESAELSPFKEDFINGAYIVYAHSVLQREASAGYLSEWAKKEFDTVFAKNDFFVELGSKLSVEKESKLSCAAELTASEVLKKL